MFKYNILSYEKLQRDIKPACNALNAKLARPEIEQTFAILGKDLRRLQRGESFFLWK